MRDSNIGLKPVVFDTEPRERQESKMTLTDFVSGLYDSSTTVNEQSRKSELGQFITSRNIAEFMASQFSNVDDSSACILDPGAGSGILFSALVDRLLSRDKSVSIAITAYEIDDQILEALRSVQEFVEQHDAYTKISIDINTNDFIEQSSEVVFNSLFSISKQSEKYTHVIMNPPYKKINSGSSHRQSLRKIGLETSNLYAAFVALSVHQLLPGGEISAIIPRSFCNGPYFLPFRKFLLDNIGITNIHTFKSRSNAFSDENVLQENVIIHGVKGKQSTEVIVTSSPMSDFTICNDDGQHYANDMTIQPVPFDEVVNQHDVNMFLRIPTNGLERSIAKRMNSFSTPLSHFKIDVATGPVVDFRLKGSLEQQYNNGNAALLYPHHFKKQELSWPQNSRKPNAIEINNDTKKWLWNNEAYFVITKRFSSKEEKKRIVASVYDGSLPGDLIGFENHLNVFHCNKRGLSKDIAFGLAAFLNSSLVDCFFRQFNGHTQVNATDLRSFSYPSQDFIEKLTRRLHGISLSEQAKIDEAIEAELDTMTASSGSNPLMIKRKIEDALAILKAFDVPKGQQNERSALTLLALVNVKPEDDWSSANNPLMGITPLMDYMAEYYQMSYAPNTRETVRRQTMHQFVDAAIATYNPDDPGRAVNSPKACYQISKEALEVIQSFGTKDWKKKVFQFNSTADSLSEQYRKVREADSVPLRISKDNTIRLSAGAHSTLIRKIWEVFGPQYVPGGILVYIGETGKKDHLLEPDLLESLGISFSKHGKMPDVVIYCEKRNWLLLIESVTSHGPVDPKRHAELAKMFSKSSAGLVYVTAFPDKRTFAKYLSDISWETEVWISEDPTHLIHFNGERFLGPYD